MRSGSPAPRKRPSAGAVTIRLAVNLAAPVLTYLLLRQHVHSDITALVASAAVPAACTAGVLLWRRHVDAIGAFALGCVAIGLLLVVATGGNELVFKIREDIWTGALGLACLISVAVRKPLLLVVVRLAGRRHPEIAERLTAPQARRIPAVATGGIGAILLAHALVIVALALTTTTTVFLAAKPPISFAIVGGGLAALVWWIHRQHAHPQTEGDRHAHHHHPQNRHHQPTGQRRAARRAG